MNQSPLNKNRQDKFILVLNLPEGIKNITDNITRNNNRVMPNNFEISRPPSPFDHGCESQP